MPSVSKNQQKFMGIVRSIQKGEQPAGKFSQDAQKTAKKMKKSSVKKYAKTKHDDLPVKKESLSASQFKAAHKKFKDTGELPPHLKKLVKDLDKVKVKHKVKNIVVPGLEWMSKIKESLEEAERDYKDEYKKFQSSTKSKKYRAELNKYNRKKGTYGNGDGKDASHKGGKIVGFESQSKNRGRAEKSRLKKESTLNENPAVIATAARMAIQNAKGKKVSVNTARQSKYASTDPSAHKKAKSIFQRIKDKFKKKDDKPKKKSAPTTAADFRRRRRGESINENDKVKVLKHLIKRGNNPKDAKKDVQKLYNKVNKMYKNASPSKKAEIISSLSAYKMESVNEANNIDKVKDIVKNKQFKRIGGVIIDMQTANAIMQVHKALSGANKKKYEKLSISKMASIAYKLIK